MALALSKQTLAAALEYAQSQKDAYVEAQRFAAWAIENQAALVAWPKNPDGTLVGFGITLAQLTALKTHAQAVVAAGDANPTARTVVTTLLEVYG